MSFTKEDKARIFGMYLGCPAKCNQNFQPNRHSLKDGRLIMSPSILADCHEGTFQYDHFQLIPTSLSEITNEDAIEVANMFIISGDEIINNPIINNFIISIDTYDKSEGAADTIFINITDLTIKYSNGIAFPFHIEIVDYLRSKHYALPYKGQDLFIEGIAILPLKNAKNGR